MRIKAVMCWIALLPAVFLCLGPAIASGSSAKGPTPSPAERYAAWLESNRGLDRDQLDYLFFEFRAVRLDVKSVRVDINIACPESEMSLRARAGKLDSVSSSMRDAGKSGGFVTRVDAYTLQFPSVIIAAAANDDVVSLDLELKSYLEQPLRALIRINPPGTDPISSRVVNVSPKSRKSEASPTCTGTWWTLCCEGCWNCGSGFCMKGSPTLNCISCTYSGTTCQNCSGDPASCSGGICGS